MSIKYYNIWSYLKRCRPLGEALGVIPRQKAPRLARALHRNRHVLAARLLEILKSWEKYTREIELHATNLDAYLKLEFYVFIDYLDRYFATGDETYKILYISEKLKQLEFGKLTPEQDWANRLRVTEEDIKVLCGHLRGELSGEEIVRLELLLREVQKVVVPHDQKELRVLLVGDCLYLDVRRLPRATEFGKTTSQSVPPLSERRTPSSSAMS